MLLRFSSLIIVFTFSSIFLFADDVKNDSISIIDRINSDSKSTIEIFQPEQLNYRILDIENEDELDDSKKKHKTHITAGKQLSYRILAFNKANKRESAYTLSQQINSRFPQYGAKITSNLPYWQVWVGTFFNEDDALKALKELQRAFPNENMTIRKKNIVVTR